MYVLEASPTGRIVDIDMIRIRCQRLSLIIDLLHSVSRLTLEPFDSPFTRVVLPLLARADLLRNIRIDIRRLGELDTGLSFVLLNVRHQASFPFPRGRMYASSIQGGHRPMCDLAEESLCPFKLASTRLLNSLRL